MKTYREKKYTLHRRKKDNEITSLLKRRKQTKKPQNLIPTENIIQKFKKKRSCFKTKLRKLRKLTVQIHIIRNLNVLQEKG